jgi:hypothetical protein
MVGVQDKHMLFWTRIRTGNPLHGENEEETKEQRDHYDPFVDAYCRTVNTVHSISCRDYPHIILSFYQMTQVLHQKDSRTHLWRTALQSPNLAEISGSILMKIPLRIETIKK